MSASDLQIFAAILVIAGCGPDRKSGTSSDTDATTSTSSSTSTSAGSTSPTTSATSTVSTASASSASSASSTASASSASSGPASTGEGCGPCENPEHVCCAGQCVDRRNDRNNCGACDVVCAEPTPYCDQGACAVAPCDTTCSNGQICCGAACCEGGAICCHVDGPVQSGPSCVAPTSEGSCPPGCSPLCMCAAPNTPVATPTGDRAIADLRPGDPVYSVDGEQIVVVPVVQVRSVPVAGHRVVRAVLDDGRVLEISASHPLGDRRSFADLRAGDRLGDHVLREVSTVPYAYPATYDILPASDTAPNFVHGVLVGSTLGAGQGPR